MREILFRGKSKGNGKWVEGNLLTDKGGNTSIALIMEPERNSILEPVIPETVGQYTGIVDTNDNKIFDGDIVTFETEEENYAIFQEILGLVVHEEIEWFVKWFWWDYMQEKYIQKQTDSLQKHIIRRTKEMECRSLKIYCNTTDNPDLLEEVK